MFLIASIIGIGIFLIAFVFDGIFDGILDFSVGETSIPIVQFIGVFLATAGGSGLVTLGLGVNNTLATLILSAAIGAILALLFAFAMSRLQKSANREHPLDTEAIIGAEAKPEPGSWEVLVPPSENLNPKPVSNRRIIENATERWHKDLSWLLERRRTAKGLVWPRKDQSS